MLLQSLMKVITIPDSHSRATPGGKGVKRVITIDKVKKTLLVGILISRDAFICVIGFLEALKVLQRHIA